VQNVRVFEAWTPTKNAAARYEKKREKRNWICYWERCSPGEANGIQLLKMEEEAGKGKEEWRSTRRDHLPIATERRSHARDDSPRDVTRPEVRWRRGRAAATAAFVDFFCCRRRRSATERKLHSNRGTVKSLSSDIMKGEENMKRNETDGRRRRVGV